MDLQLLSEPQTWISLVTLTVLEIVLGIDNIIFISILAGRLPADQQPRARTMGLGFALITRILLLCSIVWLTKLTSTLFRAFGQDISGKDLVLLLGGLFLIWKSVHEIHGNMEGEEEHHDAGKKKAVSFVGVIVQIVLIDIVFSLDSVITAVGMAQHIQVMIAAVILAMCVMLVASGSISNFVNRHPTIKMLALSFLLLIGVVLVADGFHQHVSKGYIYFAMAFSFIVEMLNLRMRGKRKLANVTTVTPPPQGA
jgi:predicted tellurium resistance membrane protein TerC